MTHETKVMEQQSLVIPIDFRGGKSTELFHRIFQAKFNGHVISQRVRSERIPIQIVVRYLQRWRMSQDDQAKKDIFARVSSQDDRHLAFHEGVNCMTLIRWHGESGFLHTGSVVEHNRLHKWMRWWSDRRHPETDYLEDVSANGHKSAEDSLG